MLLPQTDIFDIPENTRVLTKKKKQNQKLFEKNNVIIDITRKYLFVRLWKYLTEHAASSICQQTHANRTPEDCPEKASDGQVGSNRPPASIEPIEAVNQYNYRVTCVVHESVKVKLYTYI